MMYDTLIITVLLRVVTMHDGGVVWYRVVGVAGPGGRQPYPHFLLKMDLAPILLSYARKTPTHSSGALISLHLVVAAEECVPPYEEETVLISVVFSGGSFIVSIYAVPFSFLFALRIVCFGHMEYAFMLICFCI